MAKVTGSFTGTGTSSALYIKGYGEIRLNFGGGTVVVESSADTTAANFIAVQDGTFTSDTVLNVEAPLGRYFRLNCTSYSSSITYVMEAGDYEFFEG